MTALPELLPFNEDPCAIPLTLRDLPAWAPWQAVWNADKCKYDKVPRTPAHPSTGLSTAEPSKWVPFSEAVSAYRRYRNLLAGVGICMTHQRQLIGIDLDDCAQEDGTPEPWAQEIITAADTYTEASPSGTGFRIFGLGVIEVDVIDHTAGVEVYAGHEPRFLTVTGAHLAGTPLDLRHIDPLLLEDLYQRFGGKAKSADIIDLTAPELLQPIELPAVDALPLPDRVRQFMLGGAPPDQDGSALVHAAGVALYAAGLADQLVYSLLVCNPHTFAVAMRHRRHNVDRAKKYLWREHCQKAKPKATMAVASADEFELLVESPDVGAPKAGAIPTFHRDRFGRILAIVDNVAKAVRCADFCRVDIRFDQFRDEIMYSPNGLGQWRPFSDADYVRLRITLENRGFRTIGRELIRDVVMLVAGENRFDSAIAWLQQISWDNQPRIEMFLHTYLGANDTPYTRAVSRYLWTALAGRVMQPGVKADSVPILVGPQGLGKSSAVAALAPSPEFFAEISLQEKDDNLSRLMRGRLVAEIGELRGLHTKELESIKAFITRTHENWVPKYREFATQFPRRLVFVGTTNKDEFLADETGNRRWLPVRVTAAQVHSIIRDRDQMWAEARETFLLTGVHYQGVESLAIDAHTAHTITDTWVDAVRLWAHTPDGLTGDVPISRPYLRLSEVMRDALQFENKQIKRGDEMRAGAVLRGLGFERKKVREGAASFWAYVPPSAPT
jgi:hypothetical protein